MKSDTLSQLFKVLLKNQTEIVQDRNQLSIALTKVKQTDVFDQLLRTLTDYPTFYCKSRLLNVLSLVQQKSQEFETNLGAIQEEIFTQLTEAGTRNGHFNNEHLTLMLQISNLVSTVQSTSEGAHEAMASLILPFLNFCATNSDLLCLDKDKVSQEDSSYM